MLVRSLEEVAIDEVVELGVQGLSNQPSDEAANWQAKPTLMMTSKRDQAMRDYVEDEGRKGHNFVECFERAECAIRCKAKRMQMWRRILR